jgi:hypothetical protein
VRQRLEKSDSRFQKKLCGTRRVLRVALECSCVDHPEGPLGRDDVEKKAEQVAHLCVPHDEQAPDHASAHVGNVVAKKRDLLPKKGHRGPAHAGEVHDQAEWFGGCIKRFKLREIEVKVGVSDGFVLEEEDVRRPLEVELEHRRKRARLERQVLILSTQDAHTFLDFRAEARCLLIFRGVLEHVLICSSYRCSTHLQKRQERARRPMDTDVHTRTIRAS